MPCAPSPRRSCGCAPPPRSWLRWPSTPWPHARSACWAVTPCCTRPPPGAAYPAYVVEQQWTPAATGPPLVEDERLFTLIDRAALEAAGDTGRLARLATKLAAQDAALGYVDALNAHDAAAVMALWTPDFAAGRVGATPRIDGLRSAELIGSVGPRTLVLCRFDDHDETQELLWRPLDGRVLVQGQRSFRPPPA